MYAACGEILEWHWKHVNAECDPWSEPESEWHLGWKERFPSEYQEVVVGPHRADVKGPKAVLEIQKSGIAPEMIREREEFYGEMLWMLKGSDFHERFDTNYIGNGMYEFVWRTPRKTWGVAERRVLIDFGEIFEIKTINTQQTPWQGRGRFVSGVSLYEAVCGKGAPLVEHQWYVENAELHAKRVAEEKSFDDEQERLRIEEEERREYLRRVREENRLYRQRLESQRIADEIERQRQEALRIAAQLERQREEDEYRRKKAEEYEAYIQKRAKEDARVERLRLAGERAKELMIGVQWYLLEFQRGDILNEIYQRRPWLIKDVGMWSTSDLQDLLHSLKKRNITAKFCQEVAAGVLQPQRY